MRTLPFTSKYIPHNISPYQLLKSIFEYTNSHGMAPPAGLIGSWHGFSTIIIPSIELKPHVPLDKGWIGWHNYPGTSIKTVGAYCSYALCQDVTGQWLWVDVHADGGESSTSLSVEDIPYSWLYEVHMHPLPDTPLVDWIAPHADHHAHMIEQCHAAIARGLVYQVNVCTQFQGTTTSSAIDIFCSIGASVNAIKTAFLPSSVGTVLSFSPETFVTTAGNTITMSPIKGTLPIDEDPEELVRSAKDNAENVMIVDVIRNDMCKVIELFSLQVPHLCALKPAPGVWHLVSTVTGTLRAGVTHADIMEAIYPIPSVTGAPKMSACDHIAEWEEYPRKAYCGCAGMILADGDMDLSVLIRTIEMTPTGTILLGVGGGITIDSCADQEYRELHAKASSIIAATSRKKPAD